MTERKTKKAKQIQNWTMVFPNQANPNGNMFGGALLAIMDTTAAMAAKRFCESEVSTVAVEAVHFAKPFFVGDNIKTTATVVSVGNTSMMVKAEAFKDIGEDKLEKCVSAYFNLVAFSKDHKPSLVPLLEISSENEKEFQAAKAVNQAARKRDEKLALL